MRIGFEADTFLGRNASGTAKYGRRLVENLLRLEPGLEVVLFHRGGNGSSAIDPLYESCRHVILAEVPLPRLAEAAAYLRFNLTAGKPFDVVHYPRPLAYPFFWRLGEKCVVTFHDAGYRLLPKMRDDLGPLAPAPRISKRLYNWSLRAFSHKVDAAIVVSHWAKGCVAEHYGVPPERIHVIYNAPDEIFRPLPDRAGIRRDLAQRYEVSGSFVLCMGRLQPHKNIRGMLRAWALVGKDLRARHPLVILARRHRGYENIFELADTLGLRHEVTFIEQYVPDDDLVRFFNATELFVFPSLHEGFGLPLVEGLACGVPTVASNSTSLPEIAGDAALLVDTLDPEAMAAVIRQALLDDDLKKDLSQRGLLRARNFTWENSARQVLDIYRALVDPVPKKDRESWRIVSP